MTSVPADVIGESASTFPASPQGGDGDSTVDMQHRADEDDYECDCQYDEDGDEEEEEEVVMDEEEMLQMLDQVCAIFCRCDDRGGGNEEQFVGAAVEW